MGDTDTDSDSDSEGNGRTDSSTEVPPESPTPPPGRLFPGRCRDPWSMVYIDVDGWVRPCCRAIWIGMGNILAESFHSIWNNAAYRLLRETIHSDNPPDFCRTCNTGWGITQGDERYMDKLAARGIVLPKAPYIGTTYPEHGQPPPDLDAPIGEAPRTTPNVVGRRARQATSDSNSAGNQTRTAQSPPNADTKAPP
jgi:radical SAM protein with 4Fe4S-binding SPASM domain